MHTLLTRLWGANNIVVSDVNEFRLKFVEKYGVTAVNLNLEKPDDVINNNTESLGVDVTILATSSMKAFESSPE